MIRAIVVIVAGLSAGCGLLEETPEQAELRAERERQAALPLAEASCQELQRRGNRASEYILPRRGPRTANASHHVVHALQVWS